MHWGLVVATLGAFVTAWIAPPSAMWVHVWLGAGVASIALVRILWGLFGPWWERFSAFPVSRASLQEHLGDVLHRRKPKHHWPSHPPLGAVMVFILLLTLCSMVFSGAIAYGGQERAGLFSSWFSFSTGHMAAEFHETLGLFLAIAIVGHLGGVVVESVLLQSPLVKSMLTGFRPGLAKESRLSTLSSSPAWVLWAGGITIIAAVTFFANLLATQGPHQAGPALATTEQEQKALSLYETECGACHIAYPPALLPSASWVRLLSELPEHFGEDASLPEESLSVLSTWLENHAAEQWDTKAAHAFQQVNPDKPYQVTATPFWQRHHKDLPPALFASKAVGGAGNCRACHLDVRGAQSSAGFTRSAIKVPTVETLNTKTPPQ